MALGNSVWKAYVSSLAPFSFLTEFMYFLLEVQKKTKLPKFPPGLAKFNRGLTSKQLLQADLVGDDEDPEYKDKIARCLEWRVQKMKHRKAIEDQQWAKVMAKERNYIMYKKGYKKMLEDIQESQKNLSRFKGGLSVFEDDMIRQQLLTRTAAPVLSDGRLRQSL